MHYATAIIAISALAGQAIALPALDLEERTDTCKKGSSYTATYDQQTAPVGVNLNRLTAPLLGLKYEGFAVQSESLEITGLEAHSPPNTIFYNALTTTVDVNEPTIHPTLANHYIDLHSVYLGCSANLGVARIPAACTVTATAMGHGGATGLTATFHVPSDSTMTKFKFPASFNRVSQISFTTAADGIGQVIAATSLDDLAYTIYTCKA